MSYPALISERTAPSFTAVITAAQAGGAWALEHLFIEYQPALLRYLRGQAGDLADDIASETWIDASRGLRSFAGDGDAFRAWLFTIARHRLIDARRRETRQVPTVSSDVTMVDTAADTPSPEDEVVAADAGDEAARRIMSLLPPDQAEVILLRVVADLSVEQVAAIIGKRAGTVRVLQSRGLKRLSERLRKNV